MNVSGSVGRMTQQISMWEGYESLIRSGVKKQTVRYRDPFDVGDAVIVFEHDSGAVTEIPARVTGVRTVRRDELTEDDALADGFESLADLHKALDTHYPGLAADVEVDVVTFTVV